MNQLLTWIFKRLAEPSTGLGVAVLAQMAKSQPELAGYAQALDALAMAGAAQAMATPDAKSRNADD